MMVFLYDDAGSPIGFLYRTSAYARAEYDAYFYEKNFFGDVEKIYNESGTCVAQYVYNAWGEHQIWQNTNGIANLNPIRYRGYYYDTHTGLYYLQSRYYNPEWGRFISMDDPGVLSLSPDALTDKNLYIYCDNNPVMRVDEEGDAWHLLIGAAIGVAARYVSDVVQNISEGKQGAEIFEFRSSAADYIAAAASGALAASGVGRVGQIAGNMLISSTSYVLEQSFANKTVDETELVLETVAGGVSGLIGGKGANGAQLYGAAKNAKTAIKTAVSPRIISRYSKHIRAVPDAIFSGFMKSNLANASSYAITSWG